MRRRQLPERHGQIDKIRWGGVNITITSPPYNTGFLNIDGAEYTKRKYVHDNDKKSDAEYLGFLIKNVKILLERSEEVFYNVGVVSGSKNAIIGLLNEYAGNFKDFIYWVKSNPVPSIQKQCISSAAELILTFGKNGSRAFKNAQFTKTAYNGIITGTSAAATNEYARIHKATFPVYLPAEIIKNFTKENAAVLDCFGGTGTTMVACEQLNRKCLTMELEPIYCDVIIQRWQNLTGKKAERINDERPIKNNLQKDQRIKIIRK